MAVENGEIHLVSTLVRIFRGLACTVRRIAKYAEKQEIKTVGNKIVQATKINKTRIDGTILPQKPIFVIAL
jgi:hypothetical protein